MTNSVDHAHLTIATDADILEIELELDTPPTRSGETSPTLVDSETPQQKKKKKKKPKKSAKAKSEAAATAAAAAKAKVDAEGRPPVLCISRNKHWRYISSYHGPWLQLPLELLESLLVINLDPATLAVSEQQQNHHQQRLPPLLPPSSPNTLSASSFGKQRDRGGFHPLNEYHTPPGTPRLSYPLPPPFPPPIPGKPTPPPIDPGVFRSVTSIRRLIDEASALSVRASSGLSAAELGPMGLGVSVSGGGLGLGGGGGGMGGGGGNGRNVAMSAMRVHRLRTLAVQKLAEAYKMDEIASSVMVMQGGSVFDDLAERVLKVDPSDPDARYVHFFHEKIPSRQLADSTTTHVLDELIASHPQRLEYLRTRGIVHCFRDEYTLATKDFTYALKEARAARRHRTVSQGGDVLRGGRHAGSGGGGKKKKGAGGGAGGGGGGHEQGEDDAGEGDDPPLGTTPATLKSHPSALPTAPDPIEPQLLFLRGAAYLQHAVHLIESAVLLLEGVSKYPSSPDGAELRLCYLTSGLYGGVEIGNPLGPLGSPLGEKALAYRKVLGEGKLRTQVLTLVRKSMRDHERFLAHFDKLESTGGVLDEGGVGEQMEWAFYLSESIRPGGGAAGAVPPSPTSYPYGAHHPNHPHHHHHQYYHHHTPGITQAAATFTTYHPLLVESHFSVLLCLLMLADFRALIDAFRGTAKVVDGLEGYPVFLPPRSMGQAEFVEVLERLAGGWRVGAEERVGGRDVGGEGEVGKGGGLEGNEKGRLAIGPPVALKAIEAPPVVMMLGPGDALSSSGSGSGSGASSSSSSKQPTANGYMNGSSSSSSSSSTLLLPLPPLSMPTHTYPSTDTKNPPTPTPNTPTRPDAADALDCARVLLAPVVKRQRERAEKKITLERGLVTVGRSASANSNPNAAADRLGAGVGLGLGGGKIAAAGGLATGVNGLSGGKNAAGATGINGLGAGAGAGKNTPAAGGKPAGGAKKPVPINIPLHGPRVEVILAWLGAVHLPELEEGA